MGFRMHPTLSLPEQALRAGHKGLIITLIVILFLQSTFSAVSHASSSAPIAFDWQPDGLVNAVALTNDTVYIGGQFNYVGPSTGNFVSLNTTTGDVVPGSPDVNGTVNAIASDATGGWYIGGSFSAVGGIARENLAHIRANGSIDPNWNPGATLINGTTIRSIAVIGSSVYVGGDFTKIAGQNRANLAALDATTGALRAGWNPKPTHSFSLVQITTLVPVGNTLYVAGAFTNIGGKARGCLAVLDATTGLATDWDPSISVTDSGMVVNTLAFNGSTLFIGGDFTAIGEQSRWDIAALDTTKNTGNLLGWNAGFVGGNIRSIVIHNNTVYVGGGFYMINGQMRNSIAALDATTAAVSSWNAQMDQNGVNVLATDGTTLYAGGGFAQAGGAVRQGLAAFDLATNALLPAFAGTNGQVTVMQAQNGLLYIGGLFTSVGGAQRTNLAAFDRTTGKLKDWAPITAGSSYNTVYALAIAGSTVYIGGDFFTINGQTHWYLGAVDATSGAVLSWAPKLSGGGYTVVNSIQPSGSSIIVGGRFDYAGEVGATVVRNGLAAFDSTSGASTSWNPSSGDPATDPVQVVSMAVQANILYVAGTFSQLSGQPRTNIAAIDLPTGTLTNWAPQADQTVQTLLPAGATIYAGGSFSHIGGRPQALVAALDTTTGQATDWNPDLRGEAVFGDPPQVSALVLDDTNLYIGGQFSRLSNRARSFTAAIDRATGAAAPWTATLVGSPRYMHVSGSTLYLFGRFASVGITPPRSLDSISLSVITGDATDVQTGSATLHSSLNTDGLDTAVTFEVTTVSGDYQQPLVLPAVPATVNSIAPTMVSALANVPPNRYYYRAVSTNSAGTKYGAELSFDARYKLFLALNQR
jgi:trimeric autotransporter adhesin